MPHRDEEIALLRQEVEVLIGERQVLLQVAGGAAALIASLNSDELPDHAIHAADILATAVNQLTEDTLNDALQSVHVHIEHGNVPEGCAAGTQ